MAANRITKYLLSPRNTPEKSFAGGFFRFLAGLCWIGGFILAIVLGNATALHYGQFNWVTFFSVAIGFMITGIFFAAMAEVAENINNIACCLSGMKIEEESEGAERKDVKIAADRQLNEKFNTLFRILATPPDTTGCEQNEAVRILKEKGFNAVLKNPYQGNKVMITGWERSNDEAMTIILDNTRSMPDIVGMNKTEAKETLEEHGYYAIYKSVPVEEKEKSDQVIACDEKGNSVYVYYGVNLPDLTGMKVSQAEEIVRQAQLSVTEEKHFDDEIAENTVIRWENKGNGIILLVISKGPVIIRCYETRVDFDETLDSERDEAKPFLQFDREKERIEIQIILKIDSPHTYSYPRFAHVSFNNGTKEEVVLVTKDFNITRNKPSVFSLTVPYRLSDPPSAVNIYVEMMMDGKIPDKLNYDIYPLWKT